MRTAEEASLEEPAPRYFLPGCKIGLPSLRLYLYTWLGIVHWCLVPPLVARWLGRRGARSMMHGLERWWARRVVRHLRIDLDIAGLEQIRPDVQYVVAPLHEGFADALALLHLPLDLRFVARDELFTWRFLGPYLRDTGQIKISPEHGSRSYRELLSGAKHTFATGESLVVFPQGTILGIESDFMVGAFALARALNRPILPVALTGSHRAWEYPYTPRLRYGQRISLRVLPPITVEPTHKRNLDALRIEVRRRLKAVALTDGMAPPRHFVPSRDGYWDGYAYRIDPDFPELATDVAYHREAIHH